MATRKLGSVKATDTLLITSVNLAAEVGASVLPVANGGTGTGTFTNGQLLVGNTTGNTLVKASLTAPAAGFTITGGAGSITFALADDLAALEGLTGTNTIYYRSAANTWTAVTVGGLLSFSGGTLNVATGTSGAAIPLLSTANTWSAIQTLTINDAVTNTVTYPAVVGHNSTGTPAANFGVGLSALLESTTTADRAAGSLQWVWTDATDASRASQFSVTVYAVGVASTPFFVNPGSVAIVAAFAVTGNSSLTGTLTVSSSISGATVAGAMVASTAQLEAATATDVVVTPGRVLYHPGVVKAWARVAVSGANSPSIAAGESYGVSSVSRTATGSYNVTLAVTLSATGKACVICTPANVWGVGNLTPATSVVSTTVVNVLFTLGSGTPTDPTSASFHIFVLGDL